MTIDAVPLRHLKLVAVFFRVNAICNVTLFRHEWPSVINNRCCYNDYCNLGMRLPQDNIWVNHFKLKLLLCTGRNVSSQHTVKWQKLFFWRIISLRYCAAHVDLQTSVKEHSSVFNWSLTLVRQAGLPSGSVIVPPYRTGNWSASISSSRAAFHLSGSCPNTRILLRVASLRKGLTIANIIANTLGAAQQMRRNFICLRNHS